MIRAICVIRSPFEVEVWTLNFTIRTTNGTNDTNAYCLLIRAICIIHSPFEFEVWTLNFMIRTSNDYEWH